MNKFIKAEEQINKFSSFIGQIENIESNLSFLGEDELIRNIIKVKENFKLKVDDFYNENRKLNIGVIGQVKAGKSSFLNALLFDGEQILPKATTPKTATLTKIEYSKEHKIEIEYYTMEEWQDIEKNANKEIDEKDEWQKSIVQSAKELIKMVEQNNIDVENILSQKAEPLRFDTYDNLVQTLNDYVGENGKYTPLVKSITLYTNKEEFAGVSIVDTPGLNDPILSRTERTKAFIEVCDVVFFLSPVSSFLDKNDWQLLGKQLPQKGVKKLVLLGSKSDSGIRDLLAEEDEEDDIFGNTSTTSNNVADAHKILYKNTCRMATKKIDEMLGKNLYSDELTEVIGACKKPILISSMARNMVNKYENGYDREESNIYNALYKFSDDIGKDLELIGDFKPVKEVYEQTILEKDEILVKKLQSFLPIAIEELKAELNYSINKAKKKRLLLNDNDMEKIITQKREVESQIGNIKSDVLSTFGEFNASLENNKMEGVAELRQAVKESSDMEERRGTVTKTGTRVVSTSRWWNPFSWGSTATVTYTYEEEYFYLIASDATEKLRNFILESTSTVEKVFTESTSAKELKRKLLNIVVNNFDMSSEKYDSSLFKIMVEESISKIEFPIIQIDASQIVSEITSRFGGEITSAGEKENLKIALTNAVNEFFNIISNKLTESIVKFKKEMGDINDTIQTSLLENITTEFDDIIRKFEDKEAEIKNLDEYIAILEEEFKKI